MNKHRGDRATLLVFIIAILMLIPNLAHAQAARFVASNGNDGNACTRGAPCRTLQRGVDSAPPAAVVQVLDSGVYGQSLAISKSVTVLASGVAATVGRVAIQGDAGRVKLHGLHITGRAATGASAATVAVTVGAIVDIENCDLDGAQANIFGLRVDTDGAKISLVGSTVRNHSLFHGVLVTTSSSDSHVTIENSRILNNAEGVRNVGSGSEISIERTIIAGNGVGVHTQFGGLVRISNSVVTDNGVGLNHAGGTLQSRLNNMVSGNTTDTSGTITTLGGT